MSQPNTDAFGQLLLDGIDGNAGAEIYERDDNLIDFGMGVDFYFAEYDHWSATDQQAMTYVNGRVLDIGAGAGRHSLYLQEQGHELVAVDVSDGCIEVCKRRGINDVRKLALDEIDNSLGMVDSVLMLGNNFGLVGTPENAKRFLRQLHTLMPTDGRILAGMRNPYGTDNPVHLQYHERNRKAGHMAGQLKLRCRYLNVVGDWFDLLFMSPDEMREICTETGWHIATILGNKDNLYVAVLEKAL